MNINLENWNFDTFTTIVICIFLPLLLYLTYWLFLTGIIGSIKMMNSKNWNRVIGKIKEVEIKFKKFGIRHDNNVSFKFVLVKTYTYVINGQSYESNQTLASDSLFNKEFQPMDQFPKRYGNPNTDLGYLNAENEVKKLVGKPVTVYFNPKKHEIACLENRFEKEILLQIFVGLFFGAGLTYFAYYILNPMIELKYYGQQGV